MPTKFFLHILPESLVKYVYYTYLMVIRNVIISISKNIDAEKTVNQIRVDFQAYKTLINFIIILFNPLTTKLRYKLYAPVGTDDNPYQFIHSLFK